MEQIDDFFSVEALRLLQDLNPISVPSSHSQDLDDIEKVPNSGLFDSPQAKAKRCGAVPSFPGDDVDEVTQARPSDLPQVKRKRCSASRSFPGCSTLVIANIAASKPKRTKFQSKRRGEVANVRKIGACLRCRALKISVSTIVHSRD